jgi:hypothetical protein
MQKYQVQNLNTGDGASFTAIDLPAAIQEASIFFFGDEPTKVRTGKLGDWIMFWDIESDSIIGRLAKVGS